MTRAATLKAFWAAHRTSVDAIAYLSERIEFDLNRGCWLWARGCDSSGYGSVALQGWPRSAHRVSWLVHNGEIPDGMHVLHHCDTRFQAMGETVDEAIDGALWAAYQTLILREGYDPTVPWTNFGDDDAIPKILAAIDAYSPSGEAASAGKDSA